MLQSLITLDSNILLFIQEHIRTPFLTAVLSRLTRLGDGGIFWIGLTICLLISAKKRKAGCVCAVALICSSVFALVFLKTVINRTRPYEVVEGPALIGKVQTDASFPSGHTSTAFTCCTALWKYLKKPYAVSLWVLAILIALSRLYIGVHYPSDVLAGALIGIVCGLAGGKLGERLWERIEAFKSKKASLPVDDSKEIR